MEGTNPLYSDALAPGIGTPELRTPAPYRRSMLRSHLGGLIHALHLNRSRPFFPILPMLCASWEGVVPTLRFAGASHRQPGAELSPGSFRCLAGAARY